MEDDFSTQVLENVGEGIVERHSQNTKITSNIILYTDAMLILTAVTYLITRIISIQNCLHVTQLLLLY